MSINSGWLNSHMLLTQEAPAEPQHRMTMSQKVFVEILLKRHMNSYDFDYKDFESFRGLDQIHVPETPPSRETSFAWFAASKNPDLLQTADSVSFKCFVVVCGLFQCFWTFL